MCHGNFTLWERLQNLLHISCMHSEYGFSSKFNWTLNWLIFWSLSNLCNGAFFSSIILCHSSYLLGVPWPYFPWLISRFIYFELHCNFISCDWIFIKIFRLAPLSSSFFNILCFVTSQNTWLSKDINIAHDFKICWNVFAFTACFVFIVIDYIIYNHENERTPLKSSQVVLMVFMFSSSS